MSHDRRVYKSGNSYVIAIPRDYAERLEIGPGTILRLELYSEANTPAPREARAHLCIYHPHKPRRTIPLPPN